MTCIVYIIAMSKYFLVLENDVSLPVNIGSTTGAGLFLHDRVIAYPPSPAPIDTNITLFVQERVIVYPPSPLDTNV